MKAFLDTKLLVCLFDGDAPTRQARARELIDREIRAGRAVLNTQVLQEFYVTATRKLAPPLAPDVACRAVANLSALPIDRLDRRTILSAIQRCRRDQLSFWDALIVQAALSAGAEILYTEDLQQGHGMDRLRVENPFL